LLQDSPEARSVANEFDAARFVLTDDLLRKGYCGRTIGLKLRFEDFKTVTRDLTLPHPVNDLPAIRRAAGQCLKRVDLTRRIRLLGVRAGTLLRARDLPAAPSQAVEGERELFPDG